VALGRGAFLCDINAYRRILAGLLVATLAVGCARLASADEVLGNPQTPFHSMQTFEKDGERIRPLRIPVYITLRNWEGRTLGLRLRLAATFAAADLFSLIKEDLTDIQVLSFVPGMEFVYPIGRYHLLRPYADVGTGVDNATDELVLLGALGMRTDFIFPTGKFIFGLEPGPQYSFNSGGRLRDQSLVRPFATLTARRILDFRVGGYLPDAEAYGEAKDRSVPGAEAQGRLSIRGPPGLSDSNWRRLVEVGARAGELRAGSWLSEKNNPRLNEIDSRH
jgi:hypothetical protein